MYRVICVFILEIEVIRWINYIEKFFLLDIQQVHASVNKYARDAKPMISQMTRQ